MDDSNSVIIFEDIKDMKTYLNTYFLILKIFYNLNKLKINDKKTNLMMINNPKHKYTTKEITIQTDKDTIHPKEKFVVLGWTLNRRFDCSDHLNVI